MWGKMTNISIIIPTFNRAATLGKAIRSALEQTFSPLEVLVCDDGSTDKSREIVRSINDSRVRWIDGERSGRPAIPRNRGIRASRGEWLAFLDSDDEWLPEKFEKQLAHANKMGCDAVCSNAIRWIPSQEYSGPMFVRWTLGDSISFPALLQNNYVICSSVLIKKDIVNRYQGFPEDKAFRTNQDYALWLRIATFTNFAYLNEPLLIYRDEPEASIRAHSSSVWQQRITILKYFVSWAHGTEYAIKNNKEYLDLAQKSLLRARAENRRLRLRTMLSKPKRWVVK